MAEQTNIQKPQTAAKKEVSSNVSGIKSASLVILVCLAIAILFYMFVLGAPGNFKDTVNKEGPMNLLGTVYKGGIVVPVLITCFLTVLVLCVERWIALAKAKGKGNTTKFVEEVKAALRNHDLAKAEDLCRKQKGTVGAVVYATLQKYKEMEKETVMSKEQKLAAIQGTLEEATALEMPALQQNLPVLATLTTLGTLIGLFGTVLGMITSKIDNMTYAIDELGFSIVSTFSATH